MSFQSGMPRPSEKLVLGHLCPKLYKVFSTFLQPYPEFKGNVEATVKSLPDFDMDAYIEFLDMDSSVKPVAWASKPGTKGAQAQFDRFLKNGLSKFDSLRNDPNQVHICSSLSPWINHGHISFQSLAMEVKALNKYANGTAANIEEGLVRRELSDNYVYYTPDHYDSLEAAAGGGQRLFRSRFSRSTRASFELPIGELERLSRRSNSKRL